MNFNITNSAISLREQDPIIFGAISAELHRQRTHIELIASENLVSKAVLEAQGSIMTNKYAEGYPNKRYYGGCEYVDIAEQTAIDRAKKLFNVSFANVQPHSGSQANQGVFLALLKPGDTIMSLSLDCGGHLTHGSHVNLSGKWFNVVHYQLDKHTHLLDYNQIAELAAQHKPKLIITGYSAYSRFIDFSAFRKISQDVNALLLVDVAHFAGIVAAGLYPLSKEIGNYADIITTTTHKTLRGPRGGMILTNNPDIAKKIDSAIFPGLQGGPLPHVIAGKAVAFGEALQESYKGYIAQVLKNANCLGETLMSRGYKIVTDGTDTHLLLVDLRDKKISGQFAETCLHKAGLTCNKNGIPFDIAKPTDPSGIRLGSPAMTSRGMKENEAKLIANLIADVLDELGTGRDGSAAIQTVKQKVEELCASFPIYNGIN